MNAKQFKLAMTQVQKFNTIATARSAARMGTKIQAIMHGDDGLIWMTTPSTAKKLAAEGYEMVGYAGRAGFVAYR